MPVARRRARDDASRVLSHGAEELRHAVDQRGAHRLRAAQRLHRHGDRHHPRRASLHARCCRPTSSTWAIPASPRLAYSQTSNAHYETLEANQVDLGNTAQLVAGAAVGAARLADPRGGRRRRHHHARRPARRSSAPAPTAACCASPAMNYLCRDLEQLKDVSRPADRIRQDVTRSPGGDSERLPQRVHRLPLGHGPDGGRVRLLRVGRDGDAHGVHARPGPAQAPDQRERLPRRLRHGRRPLGQLLARGTERRARLARGRARAATARRASARRSRSRAPSRCARSRRSSSTSASGRRATPADARRDRAHRRQPSRPATTA